MSHRGVSKGPINCIHSGTIADADPILEFAAMQAQFSEVRDLVSQTVAVDLPRRFRQ